MTINRESIGNTLLLTDLPSPIRIAQEGYELLKKTLLEDFQEKTIYTDKNTEVVFVSPSITPSQKHFEECIANGETYSDTFSVKIQFRRNGEIIDEIKENLITLPSLTDRGTFVFKGKERALVSVEEPDGLGVKTLAHHMYDAINKELDSNLYDFNKGFSFEKYFTESGNPKEKIKNAKDGKSNLIYSLTLSELFKSKIAPLCKRNNIISTINDVNTVVLTNIQEMEKTNPGQVKFLELDRYKTLNTGRNRQIDGGGRYATNMRKEGSHYRYRRAFSAVCKLEYPEGLKKPARILAPYFKVENGKVDNKNVVWKTIEDEFENTISDCKCMDKEGNLKDGKFYSIRQGDIVLAEKDKIDYVYAYAYQDKGEATALNVADELTASARLGIGSNEQGQNTSICKPKDFEDIRKIAEYLEHTNPREAVRYKAYMPQEGQEYQNENAIVASRAAREYAKIACMTAKYEGSVVLADKDTVKIKDAEGIIHEQKIFHNLCGNNDSFVDYTTSVREGDILKRGDVIAEGRDVLNGEIQTGTPALVCCLAMGQNMEDAAIVSQSFAKRLWTPHIKNFSFEVPVSASEYKILEDVTDDRYENGIIRPGCVVTDGETLTMLKTAKQYHENYEDWMKEKDIKWKNTPIVIDKDNWTAGIVSDVKKSKPITTKDGIVTKYNIKVKYYKYPAVGNKICGQLGNKLTIYIYPDDKMPKITDERYKGTKLYNKTADIITSPTGFPTRNNYTALAIGELGCKALMEDKKLLVDPYTFDSKNFRSLGRVKATMNGVNLCCGIQYDNYYIIAEKTSKDVKKARTNDIEAKMGLLEHKDIASYPPEAVKNLERAFWVAQNPKALKLFQDSFLHNDDVETALQKGEELIAKEHARKIGSLIAAYGSGVKNNVLER